MAVPLFTWLYYSMAVAATVYIWVNIVKPAWRFCKIWKAASSFPGPPKTGFLSGHISYVTLDEAGIKYRASVWKWGRAINWQMGLINAVSATHSDTAKAILQRADPKEIRTWQFTKDWLGEGVLTSKGDKWFRNRRLITPAFHFNVLKTYVSVFQRCFENLADLWSKEAKKGQSIDVSEHMKYTTLECLLHCALGENGLLEMEKRHILKELETILELWLKRMRTLHHYFDFLYKLSADSRAFDSSVKTVNSYCMKVMENCRKAQDQNPGSTTSHRPTFVEILLNARDKEGNGLADKEILDEVNTFLFAGHDTTGSAIPYCLYFLARYPECQLTCRKEICDVIGARKEITWEDLSDLKYTTMFIKECLRMAGPVSYLSRTAGDDIILSDGRVIPKGCHVRTNLDSVHKNPEVWKNPETFDPLRFSPEQAENRTAYAFLAFSAGPRNCIGQQFAMTEIKVAMVTVLRRFTLQLDEDKPLIMAIKPLLRGSKNGIWLKMESV